MTDNCILCSLWIATRLQNRHAMHGTNDGTKQDQLLFVSLGLFSRGSVTSGRIYFRNVQCTHLGNCYNHIPASQLELFWTCLADYQLSSWEWPRRLWSRLWVVLSMVLFVPPAMGLSSFSQYLCFWQVLNQLVWRMFSRAKQNSRMVFGVDPGSHWTSCWCILTTMSKDCTHTHTHTPTHTPTHTKERGRER